MPDKSQTVLTSVKEIDVFVAATRQSASIRGINPKEKRERLKLIEKHIRTHDLKKRKAVTMAQVVGGAESDRLQLVAWMDVAGLRKPGSGLSGSTLE